MPTDISSLYPEFTNLIIQTYFFWVYDIWVQPDWTKFTQVVPSTKDAEFYPTLTAPPRMGLFEGTRRFGDAGEKLSYMIWNAEYDAGISFKRSVFQDDQYGILMKKISDLAVEGKRMPMELAFNVINYGAATYGQTGYAVGQDGQPLFSASHPGKVDLVPTDTQSNTNGAVTALTIDNLYAALAAMKTIYDNQGRPMWIEGDTLLIPPALGMVARQILHSTLLFAVAPRSGDTATPTKNIPTANIFNVEDVNAPIKTIVESPYISSTTAWDVVCTSRAAKAVTLQERMPPELTVKMDPNSSDLVFLNNMYYASIFARWGAAPGDWHMIYQGST